MRLFVAAELPEAIRAKLAAAQEGLRALPLDVRWVRPEGIHLTLVFLGEVVAARLQAIVAALAGLSKTPRRPIALEARGVGTFPEGGRPRVIWAGLTGDLSALASLQAGVAEALRAAGCVFDERPFHPHLTLGRVQGGRPGIGRDLDALVAASFGTFEVSSVHLFESRLLPGGARYESLHAFPFAAGVAS